MNPQSAIADSIALQRFHDIVEPGAVNWMPQTAGWYVLLFLMVVTGVLIALKIHRRRRANFYRREALRELAAIEEMAGDPAQRAKAVSMIPVLLKRTALAFAPRGQVASISGQEWLFLLDHSYKGQGFTEGPGKILPELSYQETDLSQEELSGLVELARVWIKKHQSVLEN